MRAVDNGGRHALQLLDAFCLTTRSGAQIPVSGSAAKVLAFVALHDGPVRRRTVAGSLWPDSPESRAAASLRSALWRLRVAPEDALEAHGTQLCLAPTLAVDLHQLLATAHDLATSRLPASPERLTTAYGAELLPDWDEEWVSLKREQWRVVRLHALELLADRLRQAGDWANAAQAGLAAVSVDPLRETAHRVLIEVYLEEGNRCDALRQFQRYEAALRDELGLRPSGDMEAMLRSSRPQRLRGDVRGPHGPAVPRVRTRRP